MLGILGGNKVASYDSTRRLAGWVEFGRDLGKEEPHGQLFGSTGEALRSNVVGVVVIVAITMFFYIIVKSSIKDNSNYTLFTM